MAEANTAVHGENQVERRLIRPREIAAYALTSYGLNNLTTYVGSTKQYFMMSFLRALRHGLRHSEHDSHRLGCAG